MANPGELMEQIYTYYADRNVESIRGTNTPWFNQDFIYDPLNRLVSATGAYGTIGYTYDKVGNRLTRTVDSQTDTYTYIPGTNKLQEITGPNPATYTHDDNGNITGIGSKTFIYNQNNRLIRAEEDSNVLGQYTYNGLGQRVTKVAGVTTVFHYDFDGNIIGESLTNGTFTAEYLYLGSSRLAKVDVSTGSIYYYHNNYLGTPQLMTDGTGKVVWEVEYKPFGEAEVNANSSVVNNFRFPGQYFDQETGLHYNYHRYYDPRTGRYLRADLSHSIQPEGTGIPYLISYLIDTPQELHNYTYVKNNPVNSFDPLGLMGCSPSETLSDRGKKSGNFCADQIKSRMANKDDYCLSDRFIFEDCTICCIELSQNFPSSGLVASTCSTICQEILKRFVKKYCCEQS